MKLLDSQRQQQGLTIAIIDGQTLLIEQIPHRDCLHGCGGRGYFPQPASPEKKLRLCRCLGLVIRVVRIISGQAQETQYYLGEELQAARRKRQINPQTKEENDNGN